MPNHLAKINAALLGLLTLLLFALALSIDADADELDFSKHHPAGAAIVTHNGHTFAAAYQQETFDVGHQPLGLAMIFRLAIVPADPAAFGLPVSELDHSGTPYTSAITDRQEAWTVHATTTGHAVMRFQDWTVETIPIDPESRAQNASNAGPPAGVQWCRVRVEPRRDAILITVVK